MGESEFFAGSKNGEGVMLLEERRQWHVLVLQFGPQKVSHYRES